MKLASLPTPLKLLAAALATAYAPAALPVDTYWVCANGKWADNCWSKAPGGLPGSPMPTGGRVFLTQSDAVSRLVDFGTGGASVLLDLLTVDATGSGTMTLQQNRDSLASTAEIIGQSGRGIYTQGGGSHIVGDLKLGNGSGSLGSYALSGSGTLNTGQLTLGLDGSGSFTQTGGTHTVGTQLVLASKAGSGTYTLAGGTLNTADIDGWQGSRQSVFNLDGGTLNLNGSRIQVGRFELASSSGSSASFELLGGKTLNADTLVIGGQGSGSVVLNGGTLNAGSIIKGQGSSRFDYLSGTLALSQGVFTVDTLNIGDGATFSTGSGMKLTTGTLNVGSHAGANMVQSGGSVTITSGLSLNAQNGPTSYMVTDGTLSAGFVRAFSSTSALIIIRSQLNLTGPSISVSTFALDASRFTLGSGQEIHAAGIALADGGQLTQNGGTVSASSIYGSGASVLTLNGGTFSTSNASLDSLGIGDAAGSLASFALNGPGTLTANNLVLGNQGQGSLVQNGGQSTIGLLKLGSAASGSGSYALNGGALTLSGAQRGAGSGSFKFNGGTLTLDGSLYELPSFAVGDSTGAQASLAIGGGQQVKSDSVTVGAGGHGAIVNQGAQNIAGALVLGDAEYTLKGGSLSVGSIQKGARGSSRFVYQGGSLTVGSGSIVVDSMSVLDNAVLQLNGASLGTGSFTLGSDQAGAGVEQVGGTTTISGALQFKGVASQSGYSLVSGNLTVGSVSSDSNASQLLIRTARLTLTGQTLQVPRLTLDGSSFALLAGQTILAQQVQIDNDASLTQNDGHHGVDEIAFGASSGGGNSYTLAGGTLDVAKISHAGTGPSRFNFDGGMLNLSGSMALPTFTIGNAPGSDVAWSLGGNAALDVGALVLGNQGRGRLTQGGGAQRVGQLAMGLGPGSAGSYTLAGGTLELSSFAAGAGANTFNLDGGTLTFSGALQGFGDFNVGNASGSNGSLSLDASRMLGVSHMTLGAGGAGHVTQSGGTSIIGRLDIVNGSYGLGGGTLTIDRSFDNGDTFTLAGGTLGGAGALVNNALFSGFGSIGGSGGFTNNGLVSQSGGNLTLANTGFNSNAGNFDIAPGLQFKLAGATLHNSGTLNLNGGSVTGSGLLVNETGGNVAGRGSITTAFTNAGWLSVNGGTLRVSPAFTNSGSILLGGSGALLAGGNLTNNGVLQGSGGVSNLVQNNGSIEALGGTLSFSAALGNGSGGTLRAAGGSQISVAGLDNQGLVSLSGGTLDARGGPLSSSGRIAGWGRLAGGSLSNAGAISFAGGSSIVDGALGNTGQILVDHASVVFTGPVVNDGTLKLDEGTATFAGGYSGNGAFFSDPSTIHASDFGIGSGGYLVGGAGDVWDISGRFANQSQQAQHWNTTAALLRLSSGGSQTLELAGADLGGRDRSGYAANFAWGGLSLAAGTRLALLDGNTAPGAALYVGTLDLGGGLAQLADITSPFNVYYDAHLAANGYLGGRSYALNGGGQLIAAVPEPATLALWLAGLALLGSWRLQRRGY